MKLHEIFVAAINILMFIFLLFPDSLKELLKMDPYRLAVVSVFIACSMYWIYRIAMFLVERRNPLKRLKDVRVIRNTITGYHYLIEGNNCQHIPDPPTFEYLGRYFGFSWNDAKPMEPDDIKDTFVMGKQLPSILAHCPK